MDFKEIQKRLKTQDNRATADPIFIVYDWERIPTSDKYSEEFMFIHDGDKIAETRNEFIEFLKDNDYDLPEQGLKEMDDDDLIEWLYKDSGSADFDKVYYLKRRVFINVFFTEKAADDFIKQNHYHYTKEVHTYVNCLWRNPEMQIIRQSLIDGKLKGVKPNSSHD